MVAAEIAIQVGEEPEDDVEAIPFYISIASSSNHHGSSSLQAGPRKEKQRRSTWNPSLHRFKVDYEKPFFVLAGEWATKTADVGRNENCRRRTEMCVADGTDISFFV
jgi:hypothetical protein